MYVIIMYRRFFVFVICVGGMKGGYNIILIWYYNICMFFVVFLWILIKIG